MELSCYDLSWTSSESGVHLQALVKDGDGKRVEEIPAPFDPYCYIEEDDLVMDPLRVTGCRIGQGAPDGFLKIEADHPNAIKDFRDRFAFQTFEADVFFDRRVAINEDVTFERPGPEETLYFDIEVDDRGQFADPEGADDRVIAIAAVGGDGEEFYFDDDDEDDLLRGFLEAADDYVALAGWNALDYDYRYLENRLANKGETVHWRRWVRHDVMPLYDMLGVPTKTVSLKLDDTGERELGAGKTGVKPGDGRLWDLWQNDPDTLEEYNMQDADLVRRIDEKYGLVDLLHVITDLTNYPPGGACYLTKHDQVRFAIGQVVDAKLLEVAHRKGIPQPNKRTYEKPPDFPGGYVLEPEPGMYEDLVVPDYSGMYPNIVRAWNFGRETWVPDDKLIDGGDVWVISEGEYEGYRAIKGETGGFVHPDEGPRSVPAEAADELVGMREGAPDIVDKGVKAINNTIYGVAAADHQRYFGPHSENITLIGQKLTGTVERIANEGHYGIKQVVYGDSVPGYEPIVWKRDGKVNVTRIDEVPCDADEVRSRTGWTTLEGVIEKSSKKQMYRVITGAGIVHVTEDHSLILADGEERGPNDVSVGDRLMHNSVHEADAGSMPDESYQSQDAEAWLMGVFVGDGSAGVYAEGTQDQKSQWKVTKNDESLLKEVGEALKSVHGLNYKIRDSYTDDSKFVTPVDSIKPIAEEYRMRCYNEAGDKHVPHSILNSDRNSVLSFLAGYARADGENEPRSKKLLTRFSSKSHVLAQGIRVLLQRLDIDMGVETKDNYGNEYLRAWPRAWSRGDPTEIESIEKVDYEGDYVYDLTTADESFGAGVGDIIVHNTDSVMIDMDVPESEDAIDMAHVISDEIEAEMQDWARDRGAIAEHLTLDVDDVYDRFYIGDKKKRYFGHRVFDGEECDDFKVRGFETRQGDWPEPVRDFQEDLMRAKLDGDPVQPIIDEARDRLFNGEWDLEMVTSTTLSQPLDEYDTKLPHTRAAEMIRSHQGHSAVQVGDKVDYIKYSDRKTDVAWVYDGEIGINFRPNEGYCGECDEVVDEDGHGHETEPHPHFRRDHYSYLWRKKFESVMGSIGVEEHEQTGLGAFA